MYMTRRLSSLLFDAKELLTIRCGWESTECLHKLTKRTLLVIQFANCLTCILNHPSLPEAKILQADQIIWK